MIRARSTRLVGSVRDREISCKRCRCSASVGSAITRRGATTGSPNPIPSPRLLPHLAQHAKSNPNILIFWNLYTSIRQLGGAVAHSIPKRFGKSRIVEDPDLSRRKKSRHSLRIAGARQPAGDDDPVVAGEHPGEAPAVTLCQKLPQAPLPLRVSP